MSTEPEDDLDVTAELPQLDITAEHLQFAADGTDATDYLPVQLHAGSVKGTQPERRDGRGSPSGWSTADELISVRDKIVDLEAALLDAELKTAKLDKQHQELLAAHVALQGHETEIIRDRDRLAADRDLLTESRQQLRQQFEQHQTEAAAGILSLQQQLEQLQQQAAEQQALKLRTERQHRKELEAHNKQAKQLTAELHDTQARAQELESTLQSVEQARAQQELAAAALSRNLTHELFEKEAVLHIVALREQRIAALETAGQMLQAQLNATENQRSAALADVQALQDSVQLHLQRHAQLQEGLRQAEQRTARLSEQLDGEQVRNRTAEQDKDRLTRLAAAEHETFESARQELTNRLAELNAAQEQLGQARVEIATLQQQLVEHSARLRERDAALAAQQVALQTASDEHAATHQREISLAENFAILKEEVLQLQAALQLSTQGHQAAELQLESERLARQQVQTQLEELRKELQQLQANWQQRDQFILDQAAELDETQRSAAEFEDQLQRVLVLNEEQQLRIATLEREQEPLRAEHSQQAQLLAQTRQELHAKQAEQGATAQQVEALQQELRRHVEALSDIRHDIHQVAQQSRQRNSEVEVKVRTLVRIDDESVVHLLNKPVIVIGRANDADICIRSNAISRRHACLRVGKDVVIIEDLGSTNGCYVNGKRTKRQLLKDGDRLEVGDMKFRFTTRAAQS